MNFLLFPSILSDVSYVLRNDYGDSKNKPAHDHDQVSEIPAKKNQSKQTNK